MLYKEVKAYLRQGITVMQGIILRNIENETSESFEKDWEFEEDFRILRTKGLIASNNKLTLEGKEILNKAKSEDKDYFTSLHKRLQAELMRLTNKKQIMFQGKYAYLCNATDLKLKLQRVMKKYGIEDLNKIELVLLSYINICAQNKFEKMSTLEYYILKDGISKFVTDYENFDGLVEEKVGVDEYTTEG